jgi:two-component sensor histidine kinase
VDDDDGLRRLVARALDRRGFDVVTADRGDAALELARSDRFDVIALDHYMPGMSGFATLEAMLREIPDVPPIVFVTGSDETRVAVAALKAGAADYVVKTVGEDFFDLLASSFTQAIEKEKLRRRSAEAEAELRAGNQRLEILLREVNHRVANSLQLVSAFVHMQAAHVGDGAARAALEDTQRRIHAIGQVHRRLYTGDDVAGVDMQAYLEALVSELEGTFSTPAAERRLVLAVDPVRLETDRAVSLGVIVNELISNACKYAYAPSQPGEVLVALRQEPGGLRLTVEDHGQGMDPSAPPRGTGLGGRLINAMAKTLGSKVVYDPAHKGVRATLLLPA